MSPIFCHGNNNLRTLSVIIKANFTYVPFLLRQYLRISALASSYYMADKKVDSKTPLTYRHVASLRRSGEEEEEEEEEEEYVLGPGPLRGSSSQS